MDPAISTGTRGPRVGYFRIGVYNDVWDQSINALERTFGPMLFEVTRRKLVLADSKDSITGWFDESYSDETIKGIIILKGATRLQLATGAYVSLDATGLTADVTEVSDLWKDQEDQNYEVMTVQIESVGDSFLRRVCDLKKVTVT